MMHGRNNIKLHSTYVLTDINIWPWGSFTVDTDLVTEHLKFVYFYYELYDKSAEKHVNRKIFGNVRQRPHPKKRTGYCQTMYQAENSSTDNMEYKIIWSNIKTNRGVHY
jgi:hypothetical protein